MIERLPGKRLVLMGIGHTNAHIVRMWRMHAPENTSLTCISDHVVSTYSGMLPAVLAQQVPKTAMEIDLVRFCSSVQANLITDKVRTIDVDKREILFHERPPIAYDALSIGIGSTALKQNIPINSNSVVEIKPMQTFLHRLDIAIRNAERKRGKEPLRIVVVGSGVAGIEIVSCIPNYLERNTSANYSLRIVTRSAHILPDMEAGTRDRVLSTFRQRGVDITASATVTEVNEHGLVFSNGDSIAADLVIWSTGAAPPPLLAELGLKTDERGFLLTRDTLQTISSDQIFAVGDTGTIEDAETPKAGVYAVRQGPTLWENLQRSLINAPMLRYRPQHSFLKLINLGDGTAVGQWNRWSFGGRWVMKWKHTIDSGFMEKFRIRPMQDQDVEMQCRGCGCKVGSELLETALPAAGELKMEDAAEIGEQGVHRWVASTDFFSSPFSDPFLTGRIAALHSASDILASGAVPTSALSNIVLPEGAAVAQKDHLRDLLAGARKEFQSLGATIVGGHTIEGPRMEIGFTVIGKSRAESLIHKGHLKINDGLFLTKPIGIGVLLAAHMRSQCAADDYLGLIDAMLAPQAGYASIATEMGIQAGTDITGFGLAGHLLEMLTASQVSATIDLESIPCLKGAEHAINKGIASSLAPNNRLAAAKIETTPPIRQQPRFDLLFDPQTCGGLLFGVPKSQEDTFMDYAQKKQLTPPVKIGIVVSQLESKPKQHEKLLRVEPVSLS